MGILYVVLVALAMLVGCGGRAGGLSAQSSAVRVQTVVATTQPLQEFVHARGVLYPLRQASLSPKITAPVRRFYANRGSRVHRGQLLAVLSNQDLAARVVAARAAWDQARAGYEGTTSSTLPEEIQTAQAGVGDAKSTLAEEERLYRSRARLFRQGAIPRKEVDATAVALTAARRAYETAVKHLSDLQASGAEQQRRGARAQMESAHGQYLAAVAELGYTELRSPIDGVVAERTVWPGEIAQAGTPLLVVMDTSRVVLRLHLPQPTAAQLRVGDAATLNVPGVKGGVPARVTVISPALDPNSTTIQVWLEADNPGGRLPPGTSVDTSILIRSVPNALVVPESAILSGDRDQRVVVVGPDSRVYSHAVTTGIRESGRVQILSGIRAGDRVVVGGAYGLPDSTKVTVDPQPPPASGARD